MRNVEYSALYPINLVAEPERVVFRLKGNLRISRLSPRLTGPGKTETDGIVNAIAQQYGDKTDEEYWQLLEDPDSAADDDLPNGNPSQMATLKRILARPAAFEKVRINNVKNYLLTHTGGVASEDYNPFDWNGRNLNVPPSVPRSMAV